MALFLHYLTHSHQYPPPTRPLSVSPLAKQKSNAISTRFHSTIVELSLYPHHPLSLEVVRWHLSLDNQPKHVSENLRPSTQDLFISSTQSTVHNDFESKEPYSRPVPVDSATEVSKLDDNRFAVCTASATYNSACRLIRVGVVDSL